MSDIVLSVSGHNFEKTKLEIRVKDKTDTKYMKLKKKGSVDLPSEVLTYTLTNPTDPLKAEIIAENARDGKEDSRHDGDVRGSGKLTITITPT